MMSGLGEYVRMVSFSAPHDVFSEFMFMCRHAVIPSVTGTIASENSMIPLHEFGKTKVAVQKKKGIWIAELPGHPQMEKAMAKEYRMCLQQKSHSGG